MLRLRPDQEHTLIDVCRRYQVRTLALFGSVARGEPTTTSDIDLLVDFRKESKTTLFDLVELRDTLTALLAREVDLVTPAILRNPYRRERIVPDLRLLYQHEDDSLNFPAYLLDPPNT
jgi:predicted nucleotidyltransferase